MDDITLVAKIDDNTTIYISPVHDYTYLEYVDADNLGGASGYFITRERKDEFEILGKVTSLDAAREIFGILTAPRRSG